MLFEGLGKDKKGQYPPRGQHLRLEEVRVAVLVEELIKLAREKSKDPSQLTEEDLQKMLEEIYERNPGIERNEERENRAIQEALRRLKAEKQYK